jgi:hypothetical protein
MLVRLIKQLFLFIESELNWFKDEDLQTNLIISEAEFNKLSHLWCQPSTEYICQHPL